MYLGISPTTRLRKLTSFQLDPDPLEPTHGQDHIVHYEDERIKGR